MALPHVRDQLVNFFEHRLTFFYKKITGQADTIAFRVCPHLKHNGGILLKRRDNNRQPAIEFLFKRGLMQGIKTGVPDKFLRNGLYPFRIKVVQTHALPCY
ncbi:hypothetical protein ES703_96974 [subsurface metagenome]